MLRRGTCAQLDNRIVWLQGDVRQRGSFVQLVVIEQFPSQFGWHEDLDFYIVTTYTRSLPERTLVGRPGHGSGQLPRNVIVGF